MGRPAGRLRVRPTGRHIIKTIIHRLHFTNCDMAGFTHAWNFLRGKLVQKGYPVQLLEDELKEASLSHCLAVSALRSHAVRILPLKIAYFDGAEHLKATRSIIEALCEHGYTAGRCDQRQDLQLVEGLHIKVVTCFSTQPNEFVRRYCRFSGCGGKGSQFFGAG